MKGAVTTIEETTGPSDVLVNNAGWDKAGRFLDTDTAFWEKVVKINYM